MIPQSHLLIQEDASVFDEITRASALPIFKSNLTIARENEEKNRVVIPVKDKEASATYYAIYLKGNESMFKFLKNRF